MLFFYFLFAFAIRRPNYYVIGPNIRFFLAHSVKGLFEEGDYWAPGSDLQELKSYLMLQMLWNPAADDRAIIAEFLAGFYGAPAAPFIASYMDLFATSAANVSAFMRENDPATAAYLAPDVVLRAVALLQSAVAASAGAPFVHRCQVALLAPVYVVLLRWSEMSAWAAGHGVAWPLPAQPIDAFNAFAAVYNAEGMGAGGLSEGGHGLAWLQQQLPHA